jgi:hypothetical protein
MSEAQWPHTLHISLNQEKQVSLVLFFLGGGGKYKSFPPPSFGVCWYNQWIKLISKPL